MLTGLHGSCWFNSSPDASWDVSSLLSSRTSLPRRMPVDLLVGRRSNPCVAGSNPAPPWRVAQENGSPKLVAGVMKKEITPGECGQDYRIECRGNPEGRGSTLRTEKSVSSWICPAKPCRQNQKNTGANAEGTTAPQRRDLAGWQSRHAGPASGRIAQSLPSCRPGPDFPGECRVALQDPVVAGSNPAAP